MFDIHNVLPWTKDRSSNFTSFKILMRNVGMTTQPSGVESHNSLGSGERYHAYLRNLNTRVRDDVGQLSKKYELRLAVKSFNDTAGPSVLVPTLLVLGVFPRLPVHPEDLP